MKASSLAKAMQIAIHARVPMIVRSQPGSGKTSIGHQVIRAVEYDLVHKCVAQTDTVDLGGLPTVTTSLNGPPRATWTLADFLPTDPNARTVFFLDEFTKAPVAVQNTWAELICEGTLGGPDRYRLPLHSAFIMTGNRKSDRAGEQEMPSHIKNRVMHVHLDLDIDDYARAAYNNFQTPDITIIPTHPDPTRMDESIIAFLRRFPDHLSHFSTTEDAYPTPRSYSFVNRILPYVRNDPELQLEMISGCIGEGVAAEFVGWLRLLNEMFDPNLALTNPRDCPVPENLSIMYAVTVALAARVTKTNANNFFIYMSRLPQDMAAMCVTDAMTRDALLMQCPEGIKWGSRNHKMLIG